MGENKNGDATGQVLRHQFRPNVSVSSKLDVHARNIEVTWRKFKTRWNSYEVATRLDTETPKYRTSVFLACAGDEAFDNFAGFYLEEGEDPDGNKVVLAKFEILCRRGK